MFESLAGMVMATKLHFANMEIPFVKKKDRVVAETIYQNKINKIEATEKYEKSKLPESGYMTVEEYEQKSRAKSKKEIMEEVCGHIRSMRDTWKEVMRINKTQDAI